MNNTIPGWQWWTSDPSDYEIDVLDLYDIRDVVVEQEDDDE